MENKKLYSHLKLSVQRALLGEIVPSMRGVAIDYDGPDIIVYFYNDGEIDDDLHDNFTSIGAEIIADFPTMIIDEKILNIPFPQALPSHSHWAYLRKENRQLWV